MKTGHECTIYFRGIDGLGTCDGECRWWSKRHGCIGAKGHKSWDGEGHYTEELKSKEEKKT